MAIYPTMFVLYLGRLWPAVASGPAALAIGVGVIILCSAMNLRGARRGRSLRVAVLLLAPFVILCALAWLGPDQATSVAVVAPGGDLVGGLLVAMWNFMGWDNASTVAGEVEHPQRNYPRAMLATTALVVLTYLVPVAAAPSTGLAPQAWTTGSWVDAGRILGGSPLALAMVVGGMVCGLGMMDALVMSYSRLPMVMAQEGYLPRIFARQIPSTGAPWMSILVLSVAWSLALGLGFERLIELDWMVKAAGVSRLFTSDQRRGMEARAPGTAREGAISRTRDCGPGAWPGTGLGPRA